jgi:hypothetical protein
VPENFETSTLWASTLAPRTPDGNHEAREKLRIAYAQFRKHVAVLVDQIPLDLRDFTVHDITHLDALWEMASIATGDTFAINPAEAFVLGGSILLHDAGMSLAAYPDGLPAIRRERMWGDAVAAALRVRLGRAPTRSEVASPPPDVEQVALAELLRQLHAVQAERLCELSWQDRRTDTQYFLIHDPDLRAAFGSVIGRIAHSHWWEVSELQGRFPSKLGAPAGFPPSWTIDPLKLACILRVADAMHLDSRRAPGFLRALRKPSVPSKIHWIFQEKLHKPQLRSDRLVYTSGSSFSLTDAPAWWLCFETLQMVDRELRQVDALLSDLSYPRFAAVGVLGADDATRIAAHIPPSGWEPLDARVAVSDVAGIVETLGGHQLYGNDPKVPLRELIQNASDAIRARRLVDHLAPDAGQITVRLGRDLSGDWVQVSDDGIGMSPYVMTKALLDFGKSYWGTAAMREEWPGLLAAGFEATGRYGVGFFSVFMWGNRVRVTSRRASDARNNTKVLEFASGVLGRPVFRPARDEEYIANGGTVVRVWLATPFDDEERGLLHLQRPQTFEQMCAWLCPALDVDLYVQRESNSAVRVVRANDWVTLDAAELVERTRNQLGPSWYAMGHYKTTWTTNVGDGMRLLRRDGRIVGRLAMYREPASNLAHGVVCVGGLRASEATGVCGILVGMPMTAARNCAAPVVPLDEAKSWAQEQVPLVPAMFRENNLRAECAELALLFGADPLGLPIARTRKNRWLSLPEIRRWAAGRNEVRLVTADGGWWMVEERGLPEPHPDLLVTPSRSAEVVRLGGLGLWPSSEWDAALPAVLREVASAWGVPANAFAGVAATREAVGERDGKVVMFPFVLLLTRPTSTPPRAHRRRVRR